MSSLLFDEDVVRRVQGSRIRLGLVLENYDNTSDDDEDTESNSDSDSDSDVESSDNEGPKKKKGHVLVAWYPKGKTEVIPHHEVELHDRSLLAGDLVQRSSSDSSCGQLGTVRMVHVTCHLQALSTKQIIYDVSSSKIDQIVPIYLGTAVLLDSWIGEVEDTVTEIVVVLKNGARCALTEGAASKLTDVHDFTVEDTIFGESDGFYPGQTLRGRATIFKSARWLSGQQPIMSSKANFRVVVEEINLVKLQVRWQTRGISGSKKLEDVSSLPPPITISGSQLKRVKPLKFFSADKVQVGDKGIYQIQEGDCSSLGPVLKGSHMCYSKPEKVHVIKKLAQPKGTPDPTKKKENTNENKADNVICSTERTSVTDEISETPQRTSPSLLWEEEKSADTMEATGRDACSRRKKSHRNKEGQSHQSREASDKEELVELAHKVKSDLSRDVKLLCDLHKELCEASDGIVELTRSFQPLVATSSGKSADDIKQRIKGLEEARAQLQEQICLTKDLLRDSEKSLGDLEVMNLQAETILEDVKKARSKALQNCSSDLHQWKSENQDGVSSSDDHRNESVSDASSHSSSEHQEKSKRTTTSRRRRKQGRGGVNKKKSGSLKVGNTECVEVTHTHTLVDVEWQDGTMEPNIEASTLTPVDLLEDMHFFPGDFVTKCGDNEENVYGVVRCLDYNQRTCVVRWIRKPSQQVNIPEVIGTEDVSVYDLVEHPDFQINIGETVVRIGYSTTPPSEGENDEINERPVAGQVRWVTEDGKVLVAWVDGSESAVYPQDLYLLEGSSSISSSDEEEDGSWIEEEYHQLESDSSSSTSSSGSWETVSDHSDSRKREGDCPISTKEEVNSETEGVAKVEETESGVSSGIEKVPSNNGVVTCPPEAISKSDIGLSDETSKPDVASNSSCLVTDNDMTNFTTANVTNEDVTDCLVTNSDATKAVTNGDDLNDIGPPPMVEGSKSSETKLGADFGTFIDSPSLTSLSGNCEKVSPTSDKVEEIAIENGLSKRNSEVTDVTESLNHVSDVESKDESASVATIYTAVTDSNDQVKQVQSGTEVQVAVGSSDDLVTEVPSGTEIQATAACSCQKDVTDAGRSEGVFTIVESAPASHRYYDTFIQPMDQRKFSSALKKEIQLLRTSLPSGVKVKMFEDKMHLFSALIEGPPGTPYEDCLFYFDGHLPENYPRKPPVVHFHSYCPGKLNPNLYNEGKICVSLLDTWTGKGSEVWTGKSNLLQLLVSIQGLILNREPYFNEAGYEKHRGTTHGTESSRMYNETVLIKVMQSVTNLVTNPPAVFREETMDFFRVHATRLSSRVNGWLKCAEQDEVSSSPGDEVGFPLFPLSRGFILSARKVTDNLSSIGKDVLTTPSDS